MKGPLTAHSKFDDVIQTAAVICTMTSKTLLELQIRRNRKKLRQIDHLKHVDRNLNLEEQIKV